MGLISVRGKTTVWVFETLFKIIILLRIHQIESLYARNQPSNDTNVKIQNLDVSGCYLNCMIKNLTKLVIEIARDFSQTVATLYVLYVTLYIPHIRIMIKVLQDFSSHITILKNSPLPCTIHR